MNRENFTDLFTPTTYQKSIIKFFGNIKILNGIQNVCEVSVDIGIVTNDSSS